MSDSASQGFFATQIAQNNFGEEQETQRDAPQQKKIEEVQEQEEHQTKARKILPGLKSLLLAFNSFDTEQSGLIPLAAAKQICQEHGIKIDKFDIYYQICLPLSQNQITFDEFLFVLCLCEDENTQIQRKYENMCNKVDGRLIQFLRLLNNYRKKTEGKHDYKQAKKSKAKIEEIRERELQRRKNYLNILHQHEISTLEEKQKAHFIDFCSNWDQFMMDYEKTAADLIQKLHQKHESQMTEFSQRTMEELSSRMHFSKFILELQTKEKYLVKLQKYEEASVIQKEIQELKDEELRRQDMKNKETLEIRCMGLRKQQVSAVNSLLQNIQKDRNDQMKQRKQDSQKLIVRNKSLITQINHRHQDAIKRVYEILHNISVDEKRDPGSKNMSR